MNIIKKNFGLFINFSLFEYCSSAICAEKNYALSGNTSIQQLGNIMQDFAYNSRVIKTQWNRLAKILQDKYYQEYNVCFDPFKDMIFQKARNERDEKRKQLQVCTEKRKSSAAALNCEQQNKIIELWNEDTPEGLQRKIFHIVSYELAWRGGEATNCLIKFFQDELDNFGKPTGRISYNPIFSKTCQDGALPLTEIKQSDTRGAIFGHSKSNESLTSEISKSHIF
jgi:hypothetical protein